MKRTFTVGAAVLAVAGMMTISPALASSSPGGERDGDNSSLLSARGDKLNVVGLADGGTKLVVFDTTSPGAITSSVVVSGLTGGDTRLIGIDFLVQDGRLYGVGNDTASAGIYAINPTTGVATQTMRLTVPLSGSSFGVDFNPAAHALRIVSDNGQNLRQPFAAAGAATVNDVSLSYAAPSVAAGITGAAYTNNDLDPNTGTTLFDLDTVLNQVSIQSPANAGSLAVNGKLGVDAAGDSGFDIYSVVRNGTTVEVVGFAAINGQLYKINLFTGAAAAKGVIGAPVTDIALPLSQF